MDWRRSKINAPESRVQNGAWKRAAVSPRNEELIRRSHAIQEGEGRFPRYSAADVQLTVYLVRGTGGSENISVYPRHRENEPADSTSRSFSTYFV